MPDKLLPPHFYYMHEIKVRCFWETHKIKKNLPHGFDKPADLLSKYQNHEEDFFKVCVLLKKSDLYKKKKCFAHKTNTIAVAKKYLHICMYVCMYYYIKSLIIRKCRLFSGRLNWLCRTFMSLLKNLFRYGRNTSPNLIWWN